MNLAFAAVAAQANATASAKMAVNGEAMAPVCVLLVLILLDQLSSADDARAKVE